MKNLKKKALMAGSYVAVAALAIGGTMAYFTDTAAPIPNVMTIGNVEINQLEYERVVDENGDWVSTGVEDKYGYTPDQLQEYTQGKPLVPAVFADGAIKWDDRDDLGKDGRAYQQSWGQVGASGSNQLFDDSVKNVQDKMVFVENTGETDAYVRTIFAFEQGDIAAEDFLDVIEMNINTDGENVGQWSALEQAAESVDIGGVKYIIFTTTYKGPTSNPTGILPADSVSYPSLLQVYMKPEVTSEVAATFGDTYEILVLSQAVQADADVDKDVMLDEAFGDVNEENAKKWFVTQVEAAPESGAVRPAGVIPNVDGEVIDHLVVTDGSDAETNLRALYTKDFNIKGDLYILNSDLDGTYAMNVTADEASDAKLVVENTNFHGWVSYSGFDSASFTDCTFGVNSEGTYNYFRAYDETVLTNCEFTGTTIDVTTTEGGVMELVGDITFVNCTYNGAPITENMLSTIIAEWDFEGVQDSVRIG